MKFCRWALVKDWEFINTNNNDTFTNWDQVKKNPVGSINEKALEIRSANGLYNEWIGDVSFRDKEGIPGQGNPNFYSDFIHHYILKIGEVYYDPSYGTGLFSSLYEWGKSAIAGFRGEDEVLTDSNGKKHTG